MSRNNISIKTKKKTSQFDQTTVIKQTLHIIPTPHVTQQSTSKKKTKKMTKKEAHVKN